MHTSHLIVHETSLSALPFILGKHICRQCLLDVVSWPSIIQGSELAVSASAIAGASAHYDLMFWAILRIILYQADVLIYGERVQLRHGLMMVGPLLWLVVSYAVTD